MRIGITLQGDSFSSAHTWRKCSFVPDIIQHVEYLVPMARVQDISAQNGHRTLGELAYANSHE